MGIHTITFHQSHYRDFKAYYCEQVLKHWLPEFPGLVSYNRFVEYVPSALIPLIVFLRTCCLGKCTGVSFIDSTSLDVCLNQRIHSHDDRAPVTNLAKSLFGKLFGDKGYISHHLAQTLREMFDLQLITKLRSNMKNQLMLWNDRILLCKRAIIETVIDQLKNISQIEHSRHRSVINFFVNVLCGLIAYCRRPLKPSLRLDHFDPLPA